MQQFDPSALKNYNVKQAGGSEHEIKQLHSPRKRRERRAIYRITIENVIPASSVNGKEYHTVHGNCSFFALFCFFSPEMNTFLCPEASADGTEELSCGPTAGRQGNDGEILNVKTLSFTRTGEAATSNGFNSDLTWSSREFEVHVHPLLNISHRADSRISKIS